MPDKAKEVSSKWGIIIVLGCIFLGIFLFWINSGIHLYKSHQYETHKAFLTESAEGTIIGYLPEKAGNGIRRHTTGWDYYFVYAYNGNKYLSCSYKDGEIKTFSIGSKVSVALDPQSPSASTINGLKATALSYTGYTLLFTLLSCFMLPVLFAVVTAILKGRKKTKSEQQEE
jgi:hypothetical protein